MRMNFLLRAALAVAIVAGGMVIPGLSKPAEACCNCTTDTAIPDGQEWFRGADATVPRIQNHVESEFTGLRDYMVGVVWEDNILPALMMMTDQITASAVQQTQVVGAMMDARNQMETQQSLQKLNARAHKDYQPSVGMCEFGSTAKSLAASERKGEYNAQIMARRALDRALGHQGSASATGEDGDKRSRIKQFREKFCNPADSNSGLSAICQTGNSRQAREQINKDIDYARTVDAPWTLDVDFTDSQLQPAEEQVLALASNLYGHNVFLRPPNLTSNPDGSLSNAQSFYMDARAVLAKQSVAQNSFNAITGMKSAGTGGSRDYLKAVLDGLGVSAGAGEDAALALLGDNPSYNAQMEVLTKKIYQNPDFYTNLYDKPANVERKAVAVQAIGLMQKFDLFKSYLRNEASLAVLLELAVEKLQSDAENQINPANSSKSTPAP